MPNTLGAHEGSGGVFQASLVDVLRYTTSGIVVFLCLYVANPPAARDLSKMGQGILAAAALALGALIYMVYRALVYAPIITWLQDSVARDEPSWRTHLMTRYGISRRKAVLLFSEVRHELRPHADRTISFANVHYGYTASIVAAAFVPLAMSVDRDAAAVGLSAVAAVLFVATFLFHRRGEDEELYELLQYDDAHLDEVAQRLFNRSTDHNPEGLKVDVGARPSVDEGQ